MKHGYIAIGETNDEYMRLIEFYVIEESLEEAIKQIRYEFKQALHIVSITDCGQVSETMPSGINIKGGHIIEKHSNLERSI